MVGAAGAAVGTLPVEPAGTETAAATGTEALPALPAGSSGESFFFICFLQHVQQATMATTSPATSTAPITVTSRPVPVCSERELPKQVVEEVEVEEHPKVVSSAAMKLSL